MDTLNSIEEERLRLLGELDELRIRRMEKRAELMNEVRETHAQEIAREEKRIEALKKEAEVRLRAAESARAAQAEANRLLNDASKEAFEGDFLRFAINCRAAELIRGWDGTDQSDYARSPETYEPTAAQMVSDVRRAFECAGRPLDNDEAVNLLVCLALGHFIVLSGPTGCGKSSMIRLLAAALGLTAPGSRRFACLDADVKNAREDARFKALTRFEDDRTLRVVMLDDVNRSAQDDQSRGLLTRFEDGENESLRVVMTALDDPDWLSAGCTPARPRVPRASARARRRYVARRAACARTRGENAVAGRDSARVPPGHRDSRRSRCARTYAA